jgi:hypothetical protein
LANIAPPPISQVYQLTRGIDPKPCAPKSGKLRAPKSGKLRAPKSGKLRAPKSGKLRAPVSYILRQNAALASHAKSTALGAEFSLSR